MSLAPLAPALENSTATAGNAADPARRERERPVFGGWQWLVFLWTLVALAMVLGLFALGALVTSYGVGMAVPDGHTTFGQTLWLYRWWEASFGVQLEHTHRLAGMAVGLAVMPLAVLLFFTERRAPVRQIAQLAMMLVVVQGLLGIYRVEFNALVVKQLDGRSAGRILAAAHGSFAQIVFASLCVLAVAASPWQASARAFAHPLGDRLKALALALPFLTFGQIVAGAAFRHTGDGFWIHAPLAYLLVAATLALAALVLMHPELRRRFKFALWWLALAAFGQVILGNAAALSTGLLPAGERIVTHIQAATTAGHHFVGTLFFAGTILLAATALRTFRREAR